MHFPIRLPTVSILFLCTFLGSLSLQSSAQPRSDYDCLHWRCIGPHRGGRTVGIDAVWKHPNVWYIGVNNGGVWKSTDYGRTWNPVFDSQPTGSIGWLAIAQSRPDTVYVGSGEGLHRPDLSVGNGVYKTTDGGKTWKNMGLKNGQQIGGIAVDPNNPDCVFAAVMGHPYGPSEERGVYRTLDGGKTWKRILYIDANTGAPAVAIDPVSSKTIYADMWAARQAPWENGDWEGSTSGLFKSTDGGATWRKLEGGLPTAADKVGRIGFTICKSKHERLYAFVDASINKGGVYRSDDAGKSWRLVNNERRIWGRGADFAEVRADPLDPETVYIANTSVYRSRDGGKSFTCIKGAPGGDDYHTIWIHPNQPDLIGLASDQGATISVNGGETWSSWYNQPTAQFYHVSTDNHIPYRVYGGQQESGSVGIASRGRDGHITFRDWTPVGAEEYAYVAPDPLNPDIVYGGKGSRFDHRTGKVTRVRPNLPDLRFLRTMPILFSPVDPHMLFQAANFLLKTTDAGKTWEKISPDLSRSTWEVPAPFASVSDQGKTMNRRGVIYAVAPSPRNIDVIWCGTDDGLVWLTQDGGKNWKDVTPPGVTSWSKVSQIDAGHFADGVAYVSVNRLRCDDQKPYIYRTRDFGRTWDAIVNGLGDAPVNAAREDPVKQGLLYAATETEVWFSGDDGAHWSSLRLNMPATSIRDLIVKDDDLVIATHGRSFWILDQINLLRHPGAVLIPPSTAYLVDWNVNTDTPLPPEEPAGQNPPDGICIDYVLRRPAKSLTLEIVDAQSKLVRRFSSIDPIATVDPRTLTVDPRWIRPPQKLEATFGAHRFVWNLRIGAAATGRSGPGMAAIWMDTPLERGAFVAAGKYRVRLILDGEVQEVPLEVRDVP